MADYTYNEMMKMQNDAIRRVEEMQKRARKTAGLDENNKKEAEPSPEISRDEPRRVSMPKDYLENLKTFAANSSHNEESTAKEHNSEPPKPKTKQPQISLNKDFSLGDFNMDDDKALLLALILLLSEEGADELLIMALIYMLT